MKFDLDKTGLERVMEPWQAEAWRVLWVFGVPMTSRDIWLELAKREISTTAKGARRTVSRASVINFLNAMADMGFLAYVERSGKGGWHRVYEPAPEASDKESFKQAVASKILEALRQDWGVRARREAC